MIKRCFNGRVARIAANAIFTAFIAIMWTACGGGSSHSEIISLVSERDSLRNETKLQAKRLQKVNDVIVTLNTALDSVQTQEGLIFMTATGEGQVTRNDALRNLDRYEAVLRHQQEKIRRLEARLGDEDDETPEAMGIVANLKAQLAQKDAQIASLRAQLEKKDVDISRLRKQVQSQQSTIARQETEISTLSTTNKAYGEALQRQDEILNYGYVLIGTKKDLERKGVLRKGKLVAEGALDKSKFFRVDIRKWRDISFEAKRPRILTTIPGSAYRMTTSGNHRFSMQVTNPTDFWSISNFLIIQTD